MKTVNQSQRKSYQERVLCIDDNLDALIWRLRVIEAAKKELIFVTFDTEDDLSGRALMAALLHAAGRGVRVRILIDGISARLHQKKNDCFMLLANAENVEVRFYNPLTMKNRKAASYRMHDKYLIADDTLYILGGRNSNDLFLGNFSDKYNVDRDVLVYEREKENTSLCQLREYFERIWALPTNGLFNRSMKEKVRESGEEKLRKHYRLLLKKYPEAFWQIDWKAETMNVEEIKLLSNPVEAEFKKPQLWDSLSEYMNKGQKIFFNTPYFICDERMYEELSYLCASGKQVQMMTNGVENGANLAGCVDYLNERPRILKMGMEVYEYHGGQSVHRKTVLVDQDISIVGSFNFDMRSTYHDTELMLVIRSKELNRQLREVVRRDMELSNQVMPDGTQRQGKHYQKASISRKRKATYHMLRPVLKPIRHLL
ncbi:MAG: phosphatidylserine/phosphatidylglycerophosphate/cardiolipin synthase family protein [Lachnospiraceae bacterium]